MAGLLLALIALAAPPSVARPPTTPSVAARRTPIDGPQLRRALRAVIDGGGVGASAEVVHGGYRWEGVAGYAHLRPGRAARLGAHFRAASITKMLVSTLALQLVARGRWSLDTTIGDVRPGLWPGRDDVTLRQLLSHTSGLPDYLTAAVAGATSVPAFRSILRRRRTDPELVRLARTLPATGAPGAAYSYSNTNFVIVGMMLKRATHRSIRALLQHRVLGPAGMSESRYPTRRGLPSPALHEYAWDSASGHYLDLGAMSPTLFSSAGALVTTSGDLDRFQRALSRGRLLPPRQLAQMRSVQAVDPVTGLQYGLGSYRLPDPCSTPARPRYVYGHDGASFATLSLSLTSANGRREATAATTGRFRSLQTNVALIELVYDGLAQSCPTRAPARAESVWPVRRLADQLADRASALH